MASTPGSDLASGEIARKSQSEWTALSAARSWALSRGTAAVASSSTGSNPYRDTTLTMSAESASGVGQDAAAELSDSSGKSPVHRAGAPAALGVN